MKKNTLYSFRFMLAIMSAVVIILAFTPGCRILPGAGDYSSEGPSGVSVSGKVLKPGPGSVGPGVRAKVAAADLSGFVAAPGAEVWVEELAADPRYRTTSDASGSYVINNVPPGDHHIVSSFRDVDGVIKKYRSDIKVGDAPTVIDLPMERATKIVTGQLRDTEGKFLPAGTVLTLWGETFKVGGDGFFTSPPLPDSYSDAEIFVQLPGGNGVSSFGAPFVSDVVPAFMDLTLGADPKTGNSAPSVTLKAYSGVELVSKTNPGNILTLVAVGTDADSGDQAALTATWSVTAGTLANGASDFEKRWTAPEFTGIATISVEVKDPSGATGRAFLPILIGIDNPSQVDTGRPGVALSSNVESVSDSQAFLVTITFNETISGFIIDDINVTNGVASDLNTVTGQKVFSVKITPQADGPVIVAVPENVARDLANNQNTAATSLTITNTITPVLSSAKAITAFNFVTPAATGIISPSAKTVALAVAFGTDVTALVPAITHTGASISPNTGVAQNFTSPVTYQVTAADGTTQSYVVTVTKSDPEQISALALTSLVTAPVKGAAPVTTAIDQTQYSSATISWFEADGTTAVTGNFAAAKVYVAKLTLAAKAGYTLTGVAENSFTYTGATSVANAANTGVVAITFAATADAVVDALNLSSLVTAPVKGAAPVTTAIDQTQYSSATISWFEADGTTAVAGNFAAAKVYVAKLTLAAKAGYTLTGVAENSFTYTGATSVANAANTGVVAITFAATADAVVDALDLSSLVTAPVKGAAPVTTAIDQTQYSSPAISWFEADGSTPAPANFAAAKVYVAKFTLTAKAGYTLTGVAENSFTYTGATSVANAANTGVVAITFAATAAEPVTAIDVISGTPQGGQTLTAGALTPAAATVDYQWEVSDDGSSDWADMAGATANTYVVDLAKSAVGKYVRVVATGKDSYNSTVESAATQIKSFMGMVSVPAGTFQRDATPTNTSTVSAFSMSKYEITRAQFLAIMGTDPSDASYSSGVTDPVQYVNWYDAVAFCNKLSEAESLTKVYTITETTVSVLDWSADGYRLPTEMEWMWAAMGGGINVSGYDKAFAGSDGSNLIGDYAWYNVNSGSKTHPAGDKTANELGLYDMSGNVWEWCWDWYASYPSGAQPDYKGAVGGSGRVLRGGSFDGSAGHVTVACRGSSYPYTQISLIGFRVVRP